MKEYSYYWIEPLLPEHAVPISRFASTAAINTGLYQRQFHARLRLPNRDFAATMQALQTSASSTPVAARPVMSMQQAAAYALGLQRQGWITHPLHKVWIKG